jgi:hypothetical protein
MQTKENRPAQAAEIAYNVEYTSFQPENQIISIYQGFAKSDAGRLARMVDVLQAIKAGRWTEQVLQLRKLDAEGRADEYSTLKNKLPFATFAGTFAPCRNKASLRQPSGVMVVDVDGLSHEQAINLKEALQVDEHIFSVFLSPAHGIKALIRVDIANDAECKAAFRELEQYFQNHYGVKLDKSGSDVCRACFMSYDSNLFLNIQAKPFSYEKQVAAKIEHSEPIRIPTSSSPRLEKYIENAINYELQRIETAPAGSGTAALYAAACTAGELYELTKLFDPAPVLSLYCNAFLERGNSRNTEQHALTVFNNGFELGRTQKRQLPAEVMP